MRWPRLTPWGSRSKTSTSACSTFPAKWMVRSSCSVGSWESRRLLIGTTSAKALSDASLWTRKLAGRRGRISSRSLFSLHVPDSSSFFFPAELFYTLVQRPVPSRDSLLQFCNLRQGMLEVGFDYAEFRAKV